MSQPIDREQALREVLHSALGYLSGEDNPQARKICQDAALALSQEPSVQDATVEQPHEAWPIIEHEPEDEPEVPPDLAQEPSEQGSSIDSGRTAAEATHLRRSRSAQEPSVEIDEQGFLDREQEIRVPLRINGLEPAEFIKRAYGLGSDLSGPGRFDLSDPVQQELRRIRDWITMAEHDALDSRSSTREGGTE